MRILLHIVSNLPNIKQRPAFYTSAVHHVKSNKPAPAHSNVEGINQPVKCARRHIQSPPTLQSGLSFGCQVRLH